jgi:hypothetical protein
LGVVWNSLLPFPLACGYERSYLLANDDSEEAWTFVDTSSWRDFRGIEFCPRPVAGGVEVVVATYSTGLGKPPWNPALRFLEPLGKQTRKLGFWRGVG